MKRVLVVLLLVGCSQEAPSRLRAPVTDSCEWLRSMSYRDRYREYHQADAARADEACACSPYDGSVQECIFVPPETFFGEERSQPTVGEKP